MWRWPEIALCTTIACTWVYAFIRHGWAVLAIAIGASLVWFVIPMALIARPPGFPRIDLSGDIGEDEIVSREDLFPRPESAWRPKISLAVAAVFTVALLVCLESAT